MFAARENFRNQAANRAEPRPAVGIRERNPGTHLLPVREGMKIVTFVESRAHRAAKLSPNGGFP
jgi:hypothetical protein